MRIQPDMINIGTYTYTIYNICIYLLYIYNIQPHTHVICRFSFEIFLLCIFKKKKHTHTYIHTYNSFSRRKPMLRTNHHNTKFREERDAKGKSIKFNVNLQ